MSKTYKCSLLALSVLASFTSCSESESLQQANLSNDKITFQPSLDNSWKPLSPSSSSRAAKDAASEEGAIVVPTSYGKPLYLLPLEQDGIYIWSKDGKRITRSGALLEDGEQEGAAQTRGTTKNDILDYGSFGVTAIYKEGNQNASLFKNKDGDPRIAVATPFIHNKFWEIEDALWPKEGEVSFHAFAPYNANIDSPLGFTQDIINGTTKIKYTASNTDVANQPDLIVATNKGQKSKEALGLNFYHALTAVTFAVDKNLADIVGSGKQLTKVELRGIRYKGVCNLSLSGKASVPNAVWTLEDDRVTYSFDLTKENIIVGKDDYALTLGDQTLMMIPQTLDNAAELCFTLKDQAQTYEKKISLNGRTWEAGKSVIYKLSSKMVDVLDTKLIYYDNSWNNFDKDGQGVFYKNDPRSDFIDYKDEMGVYIVNNKTNELILENKYVYRGYGWWYIPGKGIPHNTSDLTYFFYYPYSKETQNVNLNANTAEEFFKEKIDNHNQKIITDQSDLTKIASADLQVGKGSFNAQGRITVQMKHQVGVVVLHVPSSQYGTANFKNQSYRFYYGDKNYPNRPVAGQDFTWGYAIGGSKEQYYPSLKFKDNIPHKNENKIVDDYNGYYRCPFVVPFGKTVKFQADADPAETRIENEWGYVQDISATPTRDNPIVKKNIELDMPFKRIQVQYDGHPAKLQEFDIPEATEYTLYTWGARGQTINGGEAAAPGYATGKWTATANNKKLYICCGNWQGYNNGRSKGLNLDAGLWGGGGTHIATSKIGTGETYEYVNNRDQLLIVAAGSGASGARGKKSGAGGGSEGMQGAGMTSWVAKSYGGKQDGPGANAALENSNSISGGFGFGGYLITNNQIGTQGGGGYFGGGGSAISYAGGGGSSYIGNPQLKDGQTVPGSSNDIPGSLSSHPLIGGKNEVGACRIVWTCHRPAKRK